jgi:hypothetical protein
VPGIGTPPLAAQEAPADAVGPDSVPRAVWFPSTAVVAPPLAAPREVRLRGGFLSAERDRAEDYRGRNLEAEVSVGYRIPVVRLPAGADGRSAVDLGFEFGVFSRFSMENSTKDLIGLDYRVGLPIGVRIGTFEGRFELLHVSSHLGDDFLAEFPEEAPQISREALQLMAGWRPLAAARLYAGGDWNAGRSHDFEELPGGGFRTFDTVESWALWGGAEWDGARASSAVVAPVAAAHFETTGFTRRLAATVRAGVSIRLPSSRILLDAEWRHGPSALGQFRTTDESAFGLNLEIQLGAMAPGLPPRAG